MTSGVTLFSNKDALVDVDDDFADLRDIDFSQYIADRDDNAGSMNSPSSPSVGMMSKTPFKTPVPSENADDPIELDSSPTGRPIRLRDYLPGLGSSAEPSFAVDDSQKTKVIPKSAPLNKAPPKPPPNPPPRISYSLSVSPDIVPDAPTSATTGQLADMEPGSPVAEVKEPPKPKKAAQGRKAEPKKRSTRNKKINGKKKSEPKHDDTPAPGRAEKAAPPNDIEPAQKSANEASPAKKASPVKKASPTKEPTPADETPKRPLLARMLSVLSEPGSLKWEEPLVGGRQSPPDSDGRSSAHSRSSTGGIPAVQDGTTIPSVDDDGSIHEPSIPASLAEPFEVTEPLVYDKVDDPPAAIPNKNQLSPNLRLGPDIVDPSPPRESPSKSPVKGTRKRPSPEKRGRAAQKAPAPAKRRRVHEPVKKRVVQPRAKAKRAQTREEIDDVMVVPATKSPEPETTAVPEILHMNSKTHVPEIGSPVNIAPSRGNASPSEDRTNRMANSPGLSENEAAANSPNYNASRVSRTETPDVQPVFQWQPSRPRVGKAQVDNPHPRAKVAETVPTKRYNALITPKSTSKPSGVGAMNSAEKSAPTEAPRHVQPVPPMQKPGFEAFRQHILGQLTAIEAREQNDQPSESGNPDGPATAMPDGRAPMSIVPQHTLGRVLNTITEVG